jgi:multidrug resistance efflux pump
MQDLAEEKIKRQDQKIELLMAEMNQQNNTVFDTLQNEKNEKNKEIAILKKELKQARADFDKTLSKEKLAELIKD